MRNVLVILLILSASAIQLSFSDAPSLEITYIANEGFLIGNGSKAVLVDALFNDREIDFCDVPPESVLESMEQARDPFHEVDLVLVTHCHLDHFAASSVAKHLRNNARCVLICPAQVAELLRKECSDYDKIADRVKEVANEPYSSREFHINGIGVEAHRMHHCRYMETDPLTNEKRNRHAKVENLVFVVDMGAVSFVHMGDAVLELNRDYVQSLDWEKRHITAAFVEYFDFSPTSQKIIDEKINAEHILFMHLPSEKERIKKIGARLRQACSAAFIFEKTMEKVTLNAKEPRAEGSDAGELDDLLNRVRRAIGHEKIAPGGKHLTIRSRSRVPGGRESTVETTFAADGRFLQRISGPIERVCGFDGATPWLHAWGTARELTLSERESNLVGMWIRTGYWLHPQAPLELSLERDDDADGALCIGLKLKEGTVCSSTP